LDGETEIGAVDGGLHCRIVIPVNPRHIVGTPSDGSPIEEAAA
jgi:hypothetical protein